jgi:hypothetical protein
MMMVAGPHMALGNAPRGIEYGVNWVAGFLAFARLRNITRVDAPADEMASWTNYVRSLGTDLLASKIDSWMTGVNKNVAGRSQRSVIRFSGPAPEYREYCDRVAAGGYTQLNMS